MAAPIGNKNAAKAKVWTAAIERALEKRFKERGAALDDLAEKLLGLCEEGDLNALKELGDRLEGKAHQSVAVSGDEGNPLIHEVRWLVVRPKDGSANP